MCQQRPTGALRLLTNPVGFRLGVVSITLCLPHRGKAENHPEEPVGPDFLTLLGQARHANFEDPSRDQGPFLRCSVLLE